MKYLLTADFKAQDYYAGGMLEPGRNWSAASYDFGFNGMMKDDDLKGSGDSYDFGARIYDPRTQIWLSVDPLCKMFPSYSPFNFAACNPISNIDIDGGIITPANEFTKLQLQNHFASVFTSKKNSGQIADLLSNHLSIDGQSNKITKSEFRRALKGLSSDQKSLARGYFKAITSTEEIKVLIGNGNDPIPHDYFPNQKGNRVGNNNKIGFLGNKFGGGATQINDGSTDQYNVAAGIVIQSDFNYDMSAVDVLLFGKSGETTTGVFKPYPAEDANFDETIDHEILGHGLLEGILGHSQVEGNLGAIQISNIDRRARGALQRSGTDHFIGHNSDNEPSQDVSKIPKALKKL